VFLSWDKETFYQRPAMRSASCGLWRIRNGQRESQGLHRWFALLICACSGSQYER